MDYTWKELAQMLMAETNPQTNYHGTPYTFNRFDDSKFLTGEGNMAHGPGHYSADNIKVGESYRIPTKEIYNKSIGEFVNIDPKEYANRLSYYKLKDYLVNYLDYSKDGVMPGDYVTRSTVEKNPLAMDIINNPENYEIRINKGNLYRVNVPNEYFMWKENVPLNQQNNHIQNLWQRRNIDFAKMLSPYGTQLEHDLEGLGLRNIDKIFGPMYDQLEYRNGLNDVTKRLFNRYMNELPLERQLKFLERSNNLKYLPEVAGDIKGIRAIGNTDGPVNVTFSGNNIRMANTPLQRIVNRIPTQTIGMIGRKIMATPGVQPALKFLGRSAVPLAILEGLTSPVSNDIEGMNNYNAVRGLPLQGGIKYYGD